jgi:signal transduction histidine kinase
VLDQVHRDWRSYAHRTGVELRVTSPIVHVETDPVMLRTILRNLVGNAIKYSRSRGRVLVGCRVRKNQVLVEVHDNGFGIAANRLAAIFNAFDRGDREGSGDGLGLGLHIVRVTANMLQHPIKVRSIEGKGSTFTVCLPRGSHLEPARV